MLAWSDFFDLATLLPERFEGSEASRHSAISRAYYAAFHICRDFLPRPANVGPDPSHTLVWNTFSTSSSGAEQRIGQMGYRLMHIRHRADYDLIYPNLNQELLFVLRDVEWIVDQIDDISKHATSLA